MSDSKYCSYCGAALSEGSMFCSRCGRSTTATSAAGQAPPPPYPGQRGEKGEKDEKQEKGQDEKHEKSEKGEKGGQDSWIMSLFGGLVLIWLGITFAIAYTSPMVGWSNWWNYFLVGLGVILVLEGLVLGSRRGSFAPFYGFIIGGIIVALIGVGPLFWSYSLWPYFIIVLGILIILVAIFGRRRAPRP